MKLGGTKQYCSWGRYPPARPAMAIPLYWRSDTPFDRIDQSLGQPVLAYGQGRSYGDTCLNNGGVLLDTSGLSRFMHLDPAQGLLRCEAGTTFDDILRTIVPAGWFLPVTPGTKFVSVGGAIAHDVHGKNHHRAGTFGCHVTQFELMRSSGERLRCSPGEHADLFKATIGGMGLTGLIVWAEFRLKRIASPLIARERIRFGSVEEFFALSEAADRDFEHTVAWIDCVAKGRGLGRGIFFRGNHVSTPPPKARPPKGPLARIPCDMPSMLLNRLTMKAFNTAYYHAGFGTRKTAIVHYEPFFYPLDRLLDWNRLYGRAGFLQYQCVIPFERDLHHVKALLTRIADAGTGSFLAVLKKFGTVTSPGIMSFPRPGITIALDFPFRGQETMTFLESLDRLVAECGGAVYPAKDARMSAESFRRFFPQHEAFAVHVDERFSSTFWRRVTQR